MSLKIHLVWSQMGFFSGNKVDIPAVNFPILQDQATPLWIASQMGHTSVVKELLSSGADVDAIREVKKKNHLISFICLHLSQMKHGQIV